MRIPGWPEPWPPSPRGVLRAVVVGGMSLALGTAAAAVLETPPIGISDASLVYLVPVVVTAALCGTWPAMATAFGAFVIYDFLFIEPRYTLTIEDPREWLELLLFLFVAGVIGRLTAQQAERANEASRRARESQALFAISRTLATAPSLDEAAPAIVERLLRDTGMERVWIALEAGGHERVVADSNGAGPPPPPPGPTVWSLVRTTGELPAEWLRIHLGRVPAAPVAVGERPLSAFRIRVESEGAVLGHLWATRRRAAGLPAREHTRLLALAADQIALALRREQLAREATEAEIARRSEALKSALLDSVSHDLRADPQRNSGEWPRRGRPLRAVRPRMLRTRFGNWLLRGETVVTFEPDDSGTSLTQEFRTEGLIPAVAARLFATGSYRGSFRGELKTFARLAEREADPPTTPPAGTGMAGSMETRRARRSSPA